MARREPHHKFPGRVGWEKAGKFSSPAPAFTRAVARLRPPDAEEHRNIKCLFILFWYARKKLEKGYSNLKNDTFQQLLLPRSGPRAPHPNFAMATPPGLTPRAAPANSPAPLWASRNPIAVISVPQLCK